METTSWYVLLTSATGPSVDATLGPYLTRELAESNARESQTPDYQVVESETSSRAALTPPQAPRQSTSEHPSAARVRRQSSRARTVESANRARRSQVGSMPDQQEALQTD